MVLTVIMKFFILSDLSYSLILHANSALYLFRAKQKTFSGTCMCKMLLLFTWACYFAFIALHDNHKFDFKSKILYCELGRPNLAYLAVEWSCLVALTLFICSHLFVCLFVCCFTWRMHVISFVCCQTSSYLELRKFQWHVHACVLTLAAVSWKCN